jgi:ribonuclease P protein component
MQGFSEASIFRTSASCRARKRGRPSSPQGRRRGDGSEHEVSHETHFSAIEASPCAHARLSRPHEDGRRSQGSFVAAGEGSRAAFGLTGASRSSRKPAAARYRLRGAKAFAAVFASGTRYDGHFLQLIAATASQPPGRVGFVIARKMMRRAVDRNRLRRRLRENIRAVRPAVSAYDVIVRVRRVIVRAEIANAARESQRLLSRLASR